MAKSSTPKISANDSQILVLADELAHMLHAQEYQQALDITHIMQSYLARIEQDLYTTLSKDA